VAFCIESSDSSDNEISGFKLQDLVSIAKRVRDEDIYTTGANPAPYSIDMYSNSKDDVASS
jgi:hypothetical protein